MDFDIFIVPASATTIFSKDELNQIKQLIGDEDYFWLYELGNQEND